MALVYQFDRSLSEFDAAFSVECADRPLEGLLAQSELLSNGVVLGPVAPPTPYLFYLWAELKKLDNLKPWDKWYRRPWDLQRLILLELQVNKDGYDAWQVSKLASRHGLLMPPWAGENFEEIEARYSRDERMNLDAALGFRGSRTQNEKKPNKKEGRLARDKYATALEVLCREVCLLNLLAVPITEACTMVARRAKKERRGEELVFRVPNLNADSLRSEYYRWNKQVGPMPAADEARLKAWLKKNRDLRLSLYRA